MKQHRAQLKIARLCRLAKVSRSGYYDWMARAESCRAHANRVLLVSIRTVFRQSRKTYGALRIHREFQEQGLACGKHRIARLMRLEGLRSVHRRKYRPQTTNSKHDHAISPNLLEQDFQASAVNQKWGCDISYVPTAEGWLYLAIVMDLYSRKIVGHVTGKSLHAELCSRALKQACLRRRPPKELIHHSDRGVQYASLEYRKLLQQQNFVQSMSRKGNCYDNAMVESFFHTLKVELTHRQKYATRTEAEEDINQYIAGFYNSKRKHSSLDYRSPNQYENLISLAA